MEIQAWLPIVGMILLVILPSLVAVLLAWRWRVVNGLPDQEGIEPWRSARRQLLLLLTGAALSLGLLSLLIWTNPYGREMNSSLPAFGMVPVLVVLLVLIVRNPRALVNLWATDRVLLIGLGVILLGLAALLWLGDSVSLYLVMLLAAGLALTWLVGERLGLPWLTVVGMLGVGVMVLFGGGAFVLPGLDTPRWLQNTLYAGMGLLVPVMIFLSAALVYTSLRPVGSIAPLQLGWRLGLALFLLLGCAWLVYWDGIWSAAHARAYEDHLPFVEFLISLVAGLFLTLSLPGQRRLAGPLFVVAVLTIHVLALNLGWRVSAFELTERRAERVDRAIQEYYQDQGNYPTSLDELTPRYLLMITPPVVVRQGDWCYQGGEDYYQLAYISGQFTYAEAYFLVKTYADAGNPPPVDPKAGAGLDCDALVEQFLRGERIY